MVSKRKRNVGPYQARRATKKPPTPLQKVQSKGGFRSANTRRRRERLQEAAIEAKPFVYEQLDATSADAFRLLTLLPGLDGAPIECSLKADSWSNPRCVYEALSYAWVIKMRQRLSLWEAFHSRSPHHLNLHYAISGLHWSPGNSGSMLYAYILIDTERNAAET
jgi:hypothetical protein